MENNLQKIERSLRSMARRYKSIKYSTGLAILFLMLGVNAFSEEVNGTEFIEQGKTIRSEMKDSIESIHSKIESVKAENNKKLIGARLELIKLMEQGDQVVKSPWRSWQFGANYFYSNWRGTFEGKGDKKEKYPFEGVFTRSNDTFLRNIHPDSKHYDKYTSAAQTARYLSTFSYTMGGIAPITPTVSKKETKGDITSAITSRRGNIGANYGLENSLIRQEDIVKIELNLTVSPRENIKHIIEIQDPKRPNINKTLLTLPKQIKGPDEPNSVANTIIKSTTFTRIVPKLWESEIASFPYYTMMINPYGNPIENLIPDGPAEQEYMKIPLPSATGEAKSYNHDNNHELSNVDFNRDPAIRYALERERDKKDSDALFKTYFDYGFESVNSQGIGGGTLTIKEDTNLTLDSIANLTDSEKQRENDKGRKWNTGKFFTGVSRVGTIDNATNATISNKGKINLVGPLVVGFEIQTDGDHGSGKRAVINEKEGEITDKAEEEYRAGNGLGGLKVEKINEKGEVTEAISADEKSTELKLPQSGQTYYDDLDYDKRTIEKLSIRRTPDLVNSKGEIIKKGGYTGYKVGLILSYEYLDTKDSSRYVLINKGNINFNGERSMGIQIAASGGYGVNVDAKNEGKITLGGKESYGMKLSSNISKNSTFENSENGTISINGGDKKTESKSVGMAVIEGNVGFTFLGDGMSPEDKKYQRTETIKSYIRAHKGMVKNKGIIKVDGGIGNIGMFLKVKGTFQNEITNANLISVSGNKNIGMRVVEGIINVEDIPNEHEGGKGEGQNSSGTTSESNKLTNPIDKLPQIYNAKNIDLYENENIGMVAEGESYAENKKEGIIAIKSGKRNIGMLSESKEVPQPVDIFYHQGIINNMGIIKTEIPTEGAVGMAILKGSRVVSYKSDTVTSGNRGVIALTGKEVIGIYHKGVEKKLFDNSLTPKEKAQRYVNSEFTMENIMVPNGKGSVLQKALVDVKGENSIAIYSKGKNNTTLIKSGSVTSEGGIGLYADDSTIHLGDRAAATLNETNSLTLTAKDKSLMFYNYSHTYYDFDDGGKEKVLETPIVKGNFILNNTVNGTVENGGAAFYLRSSNDDKADFLNKMFTDTEKNNKVSVADKKLNLIMKDGSTLFITQNDNIESVTNFKSLNSYGKYGLNYGNRVVIDNSSSKKYKIEKALRGKLLVDANVNLDDSTEAYNRLEYLSSWVTVNSGIKMTATQDNKIGVFQSNLKREVGSKFATPKVEDIKVLNKGNISLAGKKSIGLATSFGLVTNEGNISATGDESVGIYGADSSVIKNTGSIEIGSKGMGIYAENDLKVNNVNTAISNNKNLDITNSGSINAKSGSTNIYGIYAKNNKTTYTNATSNILHSGSIDLSNAKLTVGIYTENGKLNSSGNIAVGENSIGIKAISSEVDLKESNKINVTSAIGVLTRNGKLNSSGNITAKNGIGIDIENSKADINKGIYNLDKSIGFKISNLGANYFKGTSGNVNITGEDSVVYYLKNTSLTSNSNFVDKLGVTSNAKYVYLYAEDSDLNYENQKTVNNNGVTFVYGKNSNIILKENTNINSNNKNITAVYSENAANKNLINKGKIKLLGENSLGIYAKGINKLENSGNISVGKDSTAIYGENIANIVKNTGNIKLSSSSAGIFINNSRLENNANIESEGTASDKNIGIYSVGNKEITNNGNIILLGDQSVGMYSNEASIINNGKIKIGDSSSKNPSVGIYAKNSTVKNSNEITTGNKSVGIYGTNIELLGNAKVISADEGTAIYSIGGNVGLGDNTQVKVGANSTAVHYEGKDGRIVNNAKNIIMGDNSYGITVRGHNNKVESNTSQVALGNNSAYIYSSDSVGSITNKTNISSTGNDNYGVYSSGKVDNYGDMDFSSSVGSIGLYSFYQKSGTSTMATSSTAVAKVTNHKDSTIKVAKSVSGRIGIGMAAGNSSQNAIGHIVNYGTISVGHANSVGMYASGQGSIAENRGTIELSGHLGTDSKGQQERNIGMYLENGAKGYNYGTIKTTGSNNKGQIGLVVRSGATLENKGTINISTENGVGALFYGGGIFKNYGNMNIAGEGTEDIANLDQADTSKGIGGVDIRVRPEDKSIADIYKDGKLVQPKIIHSIPNRKSDEISTSSIGIYMSSSGINPTRPITNLGALASAGIQSADLIIGTEATEYENSKYIQLGQDIIQPYNTMIKEALKKGINKWEIYSGSLTWQATVTQNKSDLTIQNAYMTKIPYTVYAKDKNTTRDTYNFTDGLEQRYGIEAIDSKEKQLFNKLNSIGNNEGILLSQAFDEMMGHQYANIQQRVQTTGNILDKEFNHLKRDWATASKSSNKLKTFGAKGEYKTNTAGVIDNTYNAYGLAYVHENEDIKLGKAYGWYAGFVYNTYKFKDLGRSKEEMLQTKVGLFKSIPFDDNNSLNWTISGDVSYGYNKMNRKFLVVNEIFNARGRYNTYGVALKNKLGKELRLSESISLKPYGAMKVEYGKIGKIKEKSGEIRLDVKDSYYTSVKPELGIEINYKYTLRSGKIITARVGTAYENELGKVSKATNKARVAYTKADWFNLPKEKEDKKGNIKTDFSIGVEGEIYGGTANIGYDTKGNNIRAGLGIRIIF